MPDYNYDNRSQRWRDADNGRFVSETAVRAELENVVSATYDELDTLTRQMYAGNISVQQWQVSVAQSLSDAHLAQSMFAVGGRANMTQANWGRVGGVLRDEYRYLSRFANDIASGRVSEAQALARIQQYGNATYQSYWREYAHTSSGLLYWRLSPAEHCGDCLTLSGDSPYTAQTIPTYPGAGQTTCRGNCRCYLERG